MCGAGSTRPWSSPSRRSRCSRPSRRSSLRALPGFDESLTALAAHYRFRRDTPFASLPEATRTALLYGSGDEEIAVKGARGAARRRPFAGIIPLLEKRQSETRTAWLRDEIEGLVTEARCPDCDGTRLRREARFVLVGGRSIVAVSALPIGDALGFLDGLELGPQETAIARPILKDLRARLGFLLDVGLDYLDASIGAPRRCRAARASASAWRRRSARG